MTPAAALRREAGFTLLEVLVAFVIAAFALGILFQGALAGLRASQVAGRYEEAVSLAQSHMAELNQRQSVQSVDSEGTDGPVFRYHIKVTRLASEALERSLLEQANDSPRRAAGLFALSVVESWTQDGHTREVRLLGETMVAQQPSASQ